MESGIRLEQLYDRVRNALYLIFIGLALSGIVFWNPGIFKWKMSQYILMFVIIIFILIYLILDFIDSALATKIDENVTIIDVALWLICPIFLVGIIFFIINGNYIVSLICSVIYNLAAPERRDKLLYVNQKKEAKRKKDFEQYYQVRDTFRIRRNVRNIGIVVSVLTSLLLLLPLLFANLKSYLEIDIPFSNSDSCNLRTIIIFILMYILWIPSTILKYRRNRYVLQPAKLEHQETGA